MKNYTLTFGSGDPRTYTGLAPTFLIFVRSDTGATLSPPSITEIATNWGLYTFQWGTTTPISFLADAATTSPGTQGRYVIGSLDPSDRADEYGNTTTTQLTNTGTTLVAIGNTNIAIGTTILGLVGSSSPLSGLIGGAGSTFGGQNSDPIDLFGYLKRIQENLEGDQTYIKQTGILSINSRSTTSDILLRQKTVANSSSAVIKSGL